MFSFCTTKKQQIKLSNENILLSITVLNSKIYPFSNDTVPIKLGHFRIYDEKNEASYQYKNKDAVDKCFCKVSLENKTKNTIGVFSVKSLLIGLIMIKPNYEKMPKNMIEGMPEYVKNSEMLNEYSTGSPYSSKSTKILDSILPKKKKDYYFYYICKYDEELEDDNIKKHYLPLTHLRLGIPFFFLDKKEDKNFWLESIITQDENYNLTLKSQQIKTNLNEIEIKYREIKYLEHLKK